MKKRTILFTLFVLMLVLCACHGKPANNSGGDKNNTGTENPADENLDDTAYKDIERYQATGHVADYYGYTEDLTMINIEHPAEWQFKKVKNGMEIVREGQVVGQITQGEAGDAKKWTVLTGQSGFRNGIGIIQYIERQYTDGEAQYRYRYTYMYVGESGERIITLTTLCSELDQTSESKLMRVSMQKKSAGNITGLLSNELKKSSNILILGNSFISSSGIGNSLKEMLRLNGKSCSVTAISRGYATIETYINDSTYMSRIRSGEYDAVFICGLYEEKEVKNLGVLKEACEKSKTELIVFPAHNERDTTISAARAKYSSLVFLDWQGELNCLIASGVSRWDLCVNDTYNHSTELAGYVGAHMIYRAIYGEMPKGTMQYPISQSYINSILGNYASTGHVQIIEENVILYVN